MNCLYLRKRRQCALSRGVSSGVSEPNRQYKYERINTLLRIELKGALRLRMKPVSLDVCSALYNQQISVTY
jgi:hypothetical protein